jgi:hypothetical protein
MDLLLLLEAVLWDFQAALTASLAVEVAATYGFKGALFMVRTLASTLVVSALQMKERSGSVMNAKDSGNGSDEEEVVGWVNKEKGEEGKVDETRDPSVGVGIILGKISGSKSAKESAAPASASTLVPGQAPVPMVSSLCPCCPPSLLCFASVDGESASVGEGDGAGAGDGDGDDERPEGSIKSHGQAKEGHGATD